MVASNSMAGNSMSLLRCLCIAIIAIEEIHPFMKSTYKSNLMLLLSLYMKFDYGISWAQVEMFGANDK
jgi:hypothetical protein